MAVIVRRQGTHLGTLLRALDDARVPRAVPERGLSLVAEAATYPYVLALRWLVADPPRREELIEPLLTSDVVGLSPAAARGLIRLAKTTGERRAAERARAHRRARRPRRPPRSRTAREVARPRGAVRRDERAGRVPRRSGRGCRARQRLVAAGGQGLDTVVTFADVVAAASEGVDTGVEAFLEALDAGRHGPGWAAREAGGADAVQVLTAHGAAGLEFDTVIVAGAIEGNFPSLHAARADVRPRRARGRDHPVGARARAAGRRTPAVPDGRSRARGAASVLVAADAHPDELSLRSRFVDELDGVAWAPAPTAEDDQPVSVREAAALWRRQLADPSAEAWRRLAALDGLHALGADPATLVVPARLDRDRPAAARGAAAVVLAAVDAGQLRAAARAGRRARAGPRRGLPRVGGQARPRADRGPASGTASGNTKEEILAELDRRWREQEFPSKAVAAAFRQLDRGRGCSRTGGATTAWASRSRSSGSSSSRSRAPRSSG